MNQLHKMWSGLLATIMLSACGVDPQAQFYLDAEEWAVTKFACDAAYFEDYDGVCSALEQPELSDPQVVKKMIEDAKSEDEMAQFIASFLQLIGNLEEGLITDEEAIEFLQLSAKSKVSADILLGLFAQNIDFEGYRGISFEEEKLRTLAENGNPFAQILMIEEAEELDDDNAAQMEESYWKEKLAQTRYGVFKNNLSIVHYNRGNLKQAIVWAEAANASGYAPSNNYLEYYSTLPKEARITNVTHHLLSDNEVEIEKLTKVVADLEECRNFTVRLTGEGEEGAENAERAERILKVIEGRFENTLGGGDGIEQRVTSDLVPLNFGYRHLASIIYLCD